MESLDRELAKALAEHPPAKGPARLLLVCQSAPYLSSLQRAIDGVGHRCVTVQDIAAARAAIARRRFDAVLLDPVLGDGSGVDLLALIQKTAPSTKTIILVEAAAPALIIDATRRGAVDFIDMQIASHGEILQRIDAAVLRARVDQQREQRLIRLKRICEELNVARQEVSRQVDVLCNDLALAYQDISTQMSELAMETEFKTLIKQELDVEDLLRTTLEYLLAQTGPTNAAVFLADQYDNFGLGAYVNYDCPRESISVLLEHLCQAVCPQMSGELEIVSFDDAREFAEWIGVDAAFLGDSEVLAFSCHHRGDCLAVVVLFRSKKDPFDVNLASTIDLLRTAFAEQLANVIRVHHRAAPTWPEDEQPHDDEHDYNDDYGFGFGGGVAA